MAKTSAQQYVKKWGDNLKSSTTYIREGVERVSEAPGMKAAKKADKMLEGVRRAIEDGTWQKAVSGVSLEDWKKATIDKGIGRIAAGVDGAQSKQLAMAERLLAAVDNAKASIEQMPDTTFQDRMQRMVAFSTKMHETKIK